MRSKKEIAEAKETVKEYIDVLYKNDYYRGMMRALSWVQGRQSLITAEDKEKLTNTYKHFMEERRE